MAAWAAGVMAVTALLCLIGAVLLLPVADHSSSDGSPGSLAVILLGALALLAGLFCAVLLAGLVLGSCVARLRRRRRGAASG
jgi:hypothetical protein